MVSGTRPRGRPRKSNAEKAEQFSIRLPAFPKILLEIIARQKELSLSQTIEALILDHADDYKIQGVGVKQFYSEQLKRVANIFFGQEAKYIESTQGLSASMNWMLHKKAWFINSNFGRLFLFPTALLDDIEKYFVNACVLAGVIPNENDIQRIYADLSFFAGFDRPIEDAVRYLKNYSDENIEQRKPISYSTLDNVATRALDIIAKPLETLNGIPEPKPASKGPVPRKRFPKK